MYKQFFKFDREPFSIAPDPRFLFMSDRHREALAHLLYGINAGGGFVLLTGEIGAGKTTVCRCFLEQIPANTRVAYLLNPKLSVAELIRSICDEFGISETLDHQGTVKQDIDALNRHLLTTHAAGNNSVLIIDEAQCLAPDVLEQLRLLTNLETNDRKLLQIILIGQPELRSMLAQASLEQLAQRVIARYHLGRLSEAETAHYIEHRVTVAGGRASELFSSSVASLIHRITRGVPRRINLLCDRALLGAYAEGRRRVTADIVRKAAREVFLRQEPVPTAPTRTIRPSLIFALGAAVTVALMVPASKYVDTLQSKAAPPVVAKISARPVSKPIKPMPEINVEKEAVADQIKDEVLHELPSRAPGQADAEVIAYKELAHLWGVKLLTDKPCTEVVSHGLRCFHSRGGFADLRLVNRPVLLNLVDDQNTRYPVLLTHLDGARAWINLDGGEVIVSALSLARHFKGEYATMWQAPDGFRERYQGGETGEDIDWIANRLALLNGDAPPLPGLPFGPKLIKKVRDFQLAAGIKSDGVLGPVTLMLLSEDIHHSGPHLTQTHANNETRAK